MTTSYRQRAERGAALLDEVYPDWLDRIDLARFDMLYPEACSLGQASEHNYYQARQELAVDPRFKLRGNPGESTDELCRWSRAYGFEEYHADDGAERAKYRNLTIAWRKLIAERRAEKARVTAQASAPAPTVQGGTDG